jgi:hypothetical protein
LELQARAKVEERAEALLRLLELRFQTLVPADLEALIRGSTNLEQLSRWFDEAVTVESLDAFRHFVQP